MNKEDGKNTENVPIKNEDKKSFFFSGNFKNFSAKEKKLFFKLGAILIVGIVLMNIFSGGGNAAKGSSPAAEIATVSSDNSYERQLEANMVRILSKIKGAGTVEVAITLCSGSRSEYAYNTTNSQKDVDETGSSASQSTETSVSQTLATDDSGPVLVEETMPKVEGVLVVAKGASDPYVRRQLFLAVEGLFDLPAHRIVIVASE